LGRCLSRLASHLLVEAISFQLVSPHDRNEVRIILLIYLPLLAPWQLALIALDITTSEAIRRGGFLAVMRRTQAGVGSIITNIISFMSGTGEWALPGNEAKGLEVPERDRRAEEEEGKKAWELV
jgi:hypothetical protein